MQEITLAALKEMAEKIRDGDVIRITFTKSSQNGKEGEADGKGKVSAEGSMDPP